jgi:hypothetical protein
MPPAPAPDPWETLQWWESPWQAKIGMKTLARRPYLGLQRPNGSRVVVPTRVLFPYALQASEQDRIERAARVIAAAVRQAHEMYAAAQTAGVTDLSRPLLYFYGAMGLAKAATVALFGVEALEGAHGLGRASGPTESSEQAPWPTLIRWQGEGQFPMLYRAARWDDLYGCCHKDSRWRGRRNLEEPLQFHVLECIRALQYDWGTLRPTGLAQPYTALYYTQVYQAMLLPYRGPDDMYMTSEMDLATPLIQAPRVLVQYMLLYFFSILARYYPAEWQRLLAADQEPEGYVFRVAMEQVAQDYLYEIVDLLPNTPPSRTLARDEWSTVRPSRGELAEWGVPPQVVVGTPPGGRITMEMSTLDEWNGIPADACAKATRVKSARSAHEEESQSQ